MRPSDDSPSFIYPGLRLREFFKVLRLSKFPRICERARRRGREVVAVALATASHPNSPSTGQQTALGSATVQAHRMRGGRWTDEQMYHGRSNFGSPLNFISPEDGILKAELACLSSIFPGRKMLEPFGGPVPGEGSMGWAPTALATACDINAAGFFITRLPVRLHV